VIGDRCHQNADDDRNWLAELGSKDEGKQLRLVANFGQRNDAG